MLSAGVVIHLKLESPGSILTESLIPIKVTGDNFQIWLPRQKQEKVKFETPNR